MPTYLSPEAAALLVESGSVQGVTAVPIGGNGHFVLAFSIDGHEKLLGMSRNAGQLRVYRTVDTCARSVCRMGLDSVSVRLKGWVPKGGIKKS